jgi:uncharacterized protein (DUF488 family)
MPEETPFRPSIFTIGHSTRPIEEFIALLRESAVDLLVDVRAIPGSRHNPQFGAEALRAALAAAGIDYRHIPALGGRRHSRAGAAPSPNGLWRNAAFRAYADYALSAPFHAALAELLGLARSRRCAIMCAEAVWWRCHRRIVTDYLLAAGESVGHIMAPHEVEPARMTLGAQRTPTGALVYPPAAPAQGALGL